MSNTNPTQSTRTGRVEYRSREEKEPIMHNQWLNQPQSNAMGAGAMLFIAGGLEMALGLGWNQNTYILTTHHFQFCWFIGVIAGALLSAPLISYIPKRIYFIISSILVLASGIMFVSAPYNYDVIIAARYVNGVGIGFCLVPFIVHGSEVGAPTYRGAVLALEQYSFTFGIAIEVIYESQWTPQLDFEANRLHGIFLIIFAILAGAAIAFVIESPIFYLRQGNEEAALECLCNLQRPQIVTTATTQAMADLKAYVVQEENQSLIEDIRKAMHPLIKTLLYRSMVAFTFSLPFSGMLELASFISMGHAYSWPPIVYAVLRVFGVFLAVWLVDGLGRKLVSLFSLLCMAGLTIGVGVIFNESENAFDVHQMSIVCTLMLISQFFAGLYCPNTSVYLGEAFPLKIKPYCIAFCICIEQVIQIVTIVTFVFSMYNAYVYCIVVGVVMFVLFLYFCLTMPETRSSTLQEAQNRFRKLMYLQFY